MSTQIHIPRQLGISLILAFIFLALGGGLLYSSHKQLLLARQDQASARSAAQALHQRYQKAQSDESTLRETLARFKQLQQQGLIGPENRLDWAKALRDIGQARHISKLDFTLAPQRELGKLDSTGQLTSKASSMKLTLQLLHEGDLLRILADLRALPGALITPRQCTLTEPNLGASEGLYAECELDWITVPVPETPGNPAQ